MAWEKLRDKTLAFLDFLTIKCQQLPYIPASSASSVSVSVHATVVPNISWNTFSNNVNVVGGPLLVFILLRIMPKV